MLCISNPVKSALSNEYFFSDSYSVPFPQFRVVVLIVVVVVGIADGCVAKRTNRKLITIEGSAHHESGRILNPLVRIIRTIRRVAISENGKHGDNVRRQWADVATAIILQAMRYLPCKVMQGYC